jgi:predicted Ser/Thr protein kinase
MPEKIGHYTIVSQLGRGGMGVVYKAHEESLNRFVAIKVLGDHLANDEAFLSRFVREARAAGGLSHPNIIPIYFIGEDQGKHYFAMEYVSGRSLQDIIKDSGKLDTARAAQVILQAANGLAAAHDRGVIHRDIKPANLMLDERGVVKIADFGIALPLEAQTRLTATGMLMGTPGYLSPEHCMGEPVDLRADIYALGVSYYEMLTGRMPFKAESPLALLRQILQEEPPDVAQLNTEVDEETRRILMKMIAKDRNVRYQNCHDLIADLEEYVAKRGVRSLTFGLATKTLPANVPHPADEPTMFVPAAATVPPQPAAATVISQIAPPAPSPQAMVNTAPGTSPGMAAATMPNIAPPVAAPAATAPARRSASNAMIILAVIVLLLGAGGAGAYALYRNLSGEKVPAAQAAVIPAGQQATAPGNVPKGSLMASELVVRQQTEAPARNEDVAQVSAESEPVTPLTDNPARPPVIARGEQPVREKPVEAAAAREEVQRPAPRKSGVAVAVTGDDTINSPVTNVLISELEAAGLEVSDARELPATEGLLRSGASGPAVAEKLRRAGVGVLVHVKIEPTGERQLNYMGRSDTAYGSRLTVTAIDVASGRTIGSRATANLEYTQRTADREAEKAMGRVARKIAEAIAE